jgi:hypothetical protein
MFLKRKTMDTDISVYGLTELTREAGSSTCGGFWFMASVSAVGFVGVVRAEDMVDDWQHHRSTSL